MPFFVMCDFARSWNFKAIFVNFFSLQKIHSAQYGKLTGLISNSSLCTSVSGHWGQNLVNIPSQMNNYEQTCVSVSVCVCVCEGSRVLGVSSASC